MTPADVANTLEVMGVLTKLELAVAHFYAACAKAYPEDRELWEGLEDQEQLHAAHLERMGQILSERPADFDRNRSFNGAAVQTFIAYADSATGVSEACRSPRPRTPRSSPWRRTWRDPSWRASMARSSRGPIQSSGPWSPNWEPTRPPIAPGSPPTRPS